MTIHDTYSGNSSQTDSTNDNTQRTPHLNLAQLLEEEGGTPENTGLSLKKLNGMASKKDLIDFMALREDRFERQMEEIEVRILQAIRANPPKAHSLGLNHEGQPPAQPPKNTPIPGTLKAAPAVTGAPYREVNYKVTTTPNTQSRR